MKLTSSHPSSRVSLSLQTKRRSRGNGCLGMDTGLAKRKWHRVARGGLGMDDWCKNQFGWDAKTQTAKPGKLADQAPRSALRAPRGVVGPRPRPQGAEENRRILPFALHFVSQRYSRRCWKYLIPSRGLEQMD